MGFPVGTSGKQPACQCRRHKRCRFSPWVGKTPWRRAWQLTPVFWFPWWLNGKESTCSAGDPESVPQSGISPGGRNDVEHLFMRFFGLLYVFGETSTQIFYFWPVSMSCMSFLYILEINPWLVALFANIFSCSIGPLFIFQWFPILCRSLIRSHLFIFCFYIHYSKVDWKISCCNLC